MFAEIYASETITFSCPAEGYALCVAVCIYQCYMYIGCIKAPTKLLVSDQSLVVSSTHRCCIPCILLPVLSQMHALLVPYSLSCQCLERSTSEITCTASLGSLNPTHSCKETQLTVVLQLHRWPGVLFQIICHNSACAAVASETVLYTTFTSSCIVHFAIFPVQSRVWN